MYEWQNKTAIWRGACVPTGVHFCIDIERTNFNKIIAMQEPFQKSLVHCYLFLNELYAGYVSGSLWIFPYIIGHFWYCIEILVSFFIILGWYPIANKIYEDKHCWIAWNNTDYVNWKWFGLVTYRRIYNSIAL